MWRRPDNGIYKTVVVIWLTLSVASVALAVVNWMRLSEKQAQQDEAVAIKIELDSILRLLVDAETGQRGFTITGDEKYLDPFTKAEAELPGRFEHLAELARNDTNLLKGVLDLRAQAEAGTALHHAIVTARAREGFQAAVDMVSAGNGKRMMDDIRAKASLLRARQAALVSEEGDTSRPQLLHASLTSLVAGIIGIGAGVIAFWLSRMTVKHQQRERQLVEARSQAEHDSHEKTVFLANMSHEIRTPMNAILGFSELLGGELSEPKHRRYLESIRSSATSLLRLINDILDMSKIEAGVMQLHPEPTDPKDLCAFLSTVFAEPSAAKGISLECEVDSAVPHALLLDRVRLRQVLVNLVGNAVKFTDAGRVSLLIASEKERTGSQVTLTIEVTDTGVGIPPDKLEAIFKPFVQAGAHQDKERQGTGLGLSIVKRLTETMGGSVSATSVMRKGSVFRLRFPGVAISVKLPVGDRLEWTGEVDFNELQPSTLLVVDDNQINCQLVEGMFAGSHHRLHFGFNGREAVSKARDLRPDAILLDIRMPQVDGREAFAAIRKIQGLELTPVIAVTASSLLDEERDLEERFSGYIRKPFAKRELFDELALFIPRSGSPTQPPSSSGSEDILASGSSQPAASELSAALRLLIAGEWQEIRESLAINESKAFARRLEGMADKWQCSALKNYASDLLHHAESYAVADLEKQLAEFPSFVTRLDPTPQV